MILKRLLFLSTLINGQERTGLEARDSKFFLDGEEIRLLSGSIHYFRVPHQYWEDRLRKLKATGLNTVELYVSWNLHEPYRNEFVFDGNLDIVKFIELAAKLELLVIFRPGPYICAEWEWGGHPYWLLHDKDMLVRSTYDGYAAAVKSFYKELIGRVHHLMYKNGGPIIMFQVENEYAGYGDRLAPGKLDPEYLGWLRDVIKENGVDELLFTCDGGWDLYKYGIDGYGAGLDDLLWTVNFKDTAELWLTELATIQPGKPTMVMEWWTGWFDYWGEDHHDWAPEDFETQLRAILEFGSSVNFYMFHGGTNFGWMNGANWNVGSTEGLYEYQPVITSYDYDAPLSEYGQLTVKANITAQLISEILGYPIPDMGPDTWVTRQVKYDSVSAKQAANLWRNLEQAENFVSNDAPLAMEMFPVNKNRGQPYGYALYRPDIKVSGGDFTVDGLDRAMSGRANVFVNQDNQYQYTNTPGDQNIPASVKLNAPSGQESEINMLLENSGRINYKLLNDAYMGLVDSVGINGEFMLNWKTYSLPMDKPYLENLKWDGASPEAVQAPAFYRFEVTIDEPNDTFLNMMAWGKGQAYVNGENLGRYWSIGPQQTMYVPGVWLNKGINEFIFFEENKPASPRVITFSDTPNLNTLGTNIKSEL